jgi:hypothetical protein
MSKTTASDVKKARVVVEIDGIDFTLIPSPEAIMFLSNKYDGFAPLIAAIGRFNFQAIADTVCAGLGIEGAKAREMAKQVAMSGLIDLSSKCNEFASICANGGRALVVDENADQEGGKGPLSA